MKEEVVCHLLVRVGGIFIYVPICSGWGEVNPYTNLVPLQIHHVDGNSTNNKEENLEVLCPNCHSLTENFGSRNTNTPEGKSAYYCKGSSSSAE